MTSTDDDTAKDIVGRVGEAGESARSKVEASMSKASGAAREFAAQAGQASSDLYARAQGRVADTFDRLPDNAADAITSGRRAYAKGSDAVGRQIARQPIEALLLAGAIGYLVGWATNRS